MRPSETLSGQERSGLFLDTTVARTCTLSCRNGRRRTIVTLDDLEFRLDALVARARALGGLGV